MQAGKRKVVIYLNYFYHFIQCMKYVVGLHISPKTHFGNMQLYRIPYLFYFVYLPSLLITSHIINCILMER